MIRSILSILMTAIPNLWASYTIDQVAERVMPPSEADLETLTSLLKVPKALEYFMDYLINEDLEKYRQVTLQSSLAMALKSTGVTLANSNRMHKKNRSLARSEETNDQNATMAISLDTSKGAEENSKI